MHLGLAALQLSVWGDPGKAGLFKVSTIEAPDTAWHSAKMKKVSCIYFLLAQNIWVQLQLQLKLAQNAGVVP